MQEGGPSPAEGGKGIAGQAEHPGEDPSSGIWRSRRFEHDAHNRNERKEWRITGIEAVLMVVLAALAVYAGYSSAKWSTDSRLKLSQASTAYSQSSSGALASNTQKKADRLYQEGAIDGTNSDDYLLIALSLAAVLFLFTIKGHHARRKVRIGLIVVGAVLLLILGVALASLPPPPV